MDVKETMISGSKNKIKQGITKRFDFKNNKIVWEKVNKASYKIVDVFGNEIKLGMPNDDLLRILEEIIILNRYEMIKRTFFKKEKTDV